MEQLGSPDLGRSVSGRSSSHRTTSSALKFLAAEVLSYLLYLLVEKYLLYSQRPTSSGSVEALLRLY
jgi:hypothetical protein